MKNIIKPRNCPACGYTDSKELSVYCFKEWKIVQCSQCSMVYLQNPASYEELEVDYSWDTTFLEEENRRNRKRGVFKNVAKLIRIANYTLRKKDNDRYLKILGPGKILDIGCGDVVRWQPPFIPFGIEISKTLAKSAKLKMQNLGGDCLQGPGAKTIWKFEKDQFDSIFMHSYLEHETEINSMLSGSYRCLKPGGKIFIRVPNFNSLNRTISQNNWPGLRYPDHVNYFTVGTLKAVSEKTNFNFQLINKHKIWLDDNIQALLTKPI